MPIAPRGQRYVPAPAEKEIEVTDAMRKAAEDAYSYDDRYDDPLECLAIAYRAMEMARRREAGDIEERHEARVPAPTHTIASRAVH